MLKFLLLPLLIMNEVFFCISTHEELISDEAAALEILLVFVGNEVCEIIHK